jgi:hypothetical protein
MLPEQSWPHDPGSCSISLTPTSLAGGSPRIIRPVRFVGSGSPLGTSHTGDGNASARVWLRFLVDVHRRTTISSPHRSVVAAKPEQSTGELEQARDRDTDYRLAERE